MVGVEFDSCPRCTGVWLDAGELPAITRSRGGNALNATLDSQRRTDYKCPVCRPAVLLLEGTLSSDQQFELDICPTCKGLWFDRGEFPKLLQKP